tara:strand:+ start:1596 stop:1886 length:291 start_codon:yes stop_codon:yes gene_type:complete
MKSKYKIVGRLIDQGHIVIACADRILNKKTEYIQDLEDLHADGVISTTEVVELLSEREPIKINKTSNGVIPYEDLSDAFKKCINDIKNSLNKNKKL